MGLDSTSALAALAYREVSMWLPDGSPHRLALQRADSMVRRYPRTLDREPPSTWTAMVLWSQRAGTGFPQADSAARLLAAHPSVDRLMSGNGDYVLGLYQLNRGRPRQSLRSPFSRLGLSPFGASATDPSVNQVTHYGEAGTRLEQALAVPASWIDLDDAARQVEQPYDGLAQRDRLPAACNLGLWHGASGRSGRAMSLATLLEGWFDDPNIRRRAYARVCPVVIRAALDTEDGLPALAAADSLLLGEPEGLLRHDISRWNLYLARVYAERGHPELGLPLTTRLGFVVESSAWLTPALLLEAELSRAAGDGGRADRALAWAARLLSNPEPGITPAR